MSLRAFYRRLVQPKPRVLTGKKAVFMFNGVEVSGVMDFSDITYEPYESMVMARFTVKKNK